MSVAAEYVRPELFAALGDPLTLRRKINIELERRSLQGSLHAYTRAAWAWIEPGTPFIDGWHLGAISEHLQAAHDRQIRNLVINMPPRHMKSISVSVAWPTWSWTRNPRTKWVFSSYSASLSIRDSVKSRRLLSSAWYQQFWGNRFTMSTDQNQKSRYENDQTGYRIATSVTGMMTGEGGDFIVVDDPHNVVAAESALQRMEVLDWWDQAMSTRFNDPKTGVRVLVMQRLHQKDLTGHVLQEQGWDHLILPAEYEKTNRVTSLGWRDPRKEDGELLWPERYGPKELGDLKSRLGSYGAAAQLQQRPAPREGGIVKVQWLGSRYRILPLREGPKIEVRRVVQSWDTAKKADERNDYSVCTTWFETDTHHYLVDVYRKKLEFPELKRAVTDQAAKWNPQAVLIEDAASGTSLIQQLRSDTLLPVIAIGTGGLSKEVRLEAVTPTIEAGRVLLPEEAPWVADYVGELTMFPMVENDDQTDSTSQYLNWAAKPAEVFIG